MKISKTIPALKNKRRTKNSKSKSKLKKLSQNKSLKKKKKRKRSWYSTLPFATNAELILKVIGTSVECVKTLTFARNANRLRAIGTH
jgi:hypothetical protein